MPADTIEIAPPDPAWAEAFAAEARRLRGHLGELALRIEHVGSTSVPGLAAKPVIDIQISVATLNPMEAWRGPLEAHGYRHVPHSDDGHYPFLHRPESWPHTHHIHVCKISSREERVHLAFRDYLRDHPEVAADYATAKRRIASRHDSASFESRNAYAEAKSDFIRPIVERALAAGYPL